MISTHILDTARGRPAAGVPVLLERVHEGGGATEVTRAVTDADGRVREIQVKQPTPTTRWVWGAFRLTGAILRELHTHWRERDGRDEYVGTLVNAWLARGGSALGVRAGEAYVDVGTLHGYREAIRVLGQRGEASGERIADRGIADRGIADRGIVTRRPAAEPRTVA